MTKKTIAIALSFLVAAMPFLGFPAEFKTYFYLIAGLLLAGLVELVSIQSFYSKYGMFGNRVNEELDQYEDPVVTEETTETIIIMDDQQDESEEEMEEGSDDEYEEEKDDSLYKK